MSVGGIIAGTQVEVCSLAERGEGDLLVGLITNPRTWVVLRASEDAVALRRAWARGGRVVIPMPPSTCLLDEIDVAAPETRVA